MDINRVSARAIHEKHYELIVIGSGVTGVEFVHIFQSLGARVTLVVSRQQILPHRDVEVAAELAEQVLAKGRHVAVTGRLVHRNYEDKSGVKRYATEVHLKEFFLTEKNIVRSR